MKCHLPIDCVLALTYNCNARCTMCDIWKIKNSPEIPLEDFKKLPTSLRDINISGGEPFLRRDLPEIVANLRATCPEARLVISTNAFLTDLVLAQMKKILVVAPDIGVAVSIDGIGVMHDEMRGIPGGFEMSMATVAGLKKLGMKNLRLGFTVTEKNVDHLSKVYDLTRELGIEFTHSFAQSSEFYFGGKKNEEAPRRELLVKQYEHLINTELKSWNLKKWARAYFSHGMFQFITSKSPVLSNAPGRDFFFVDPSGDIYPSVVHNVVLGNIKKIAVGEFEKIWCVAEMEEKRKKVDALKVPVWMICTARVAIKKNPLKVGWWILQNKFFGYHA